MKALFLHQNCPGQFKHLAPRLAARPGHEVLFMTQNEGPAPARVGKILYSPHRKASRETHPYLTSSETAVLNGQAVARMAMKLQRQGYRPDVIVGNPGWGETLFMKDIWPDVPLVLMVEFFYRGLGADVGFDPEFARGIDSILRARVRSGPHLLAIDAADAAYAPTDWQKAQFPSAYQDKIDVIHDGIDVANLTPDPTSQYELPNGRVLTRSDEVLTFVARNLEPYRGFHSFMRALPEILRRRPKAKVVIVGGDGVSYGSAPKEGTCWREVMLQEIGPLSERVTFAGRIPYRDFKQLMQISSVHVYLTYPFVLSWSMLEAMAMGAFVVGSATPPVMEVIEDGRNGWLVDFFDAPAMAERLIEALAARKKVDELRAAARETVVSRYALEDCIERQLALINRAIETGAR
ncbi:glycosyltransferase [Jiella endophytica]|uniref:Glycosyltransferase n=1 Tax=Jiella endophytica TaxID=2558362 RepID=A0A4Y8RJ29_9HYPH|nr:glycosyltransferase family 4 protein [Jiella endophytica]TFF22797.1 glycosyltransferase [Jiella endophytica]